MRIRSLAHSLDGSSIMTIQTSNYNHEIVRSLFVYNGGKNGSHRSDWNAAESSTQTEPAKACWMSRAKMIGGATAESNGTRIPYKRETITENGKNERKKDGHFRAKRMNVKMFSRANEIGYGIRWNSSEPVTWCGVKLPIRNAKLIHCECRYGSVFGRSEDFNLKLLWHLG